MLLGALALKASLLDSYLIKEAYSKTVQYFLSAQQSCGGFFDCTPNYIRSDTVIAFYLYPQYPLVFESAKNFDEYVFMDYYNLWEILDPNNNIYTWWALVDALALLSANISDPFVVTAENIINTNFNSYGLKTALPSGYQSYFGDIPYDLMTTLIALNIAQKSERVDGNLDFKTLNSTLNPDFWQYVLKYIKGEISAPLATPTNKALLALMAFGMKWFREALCKTLNVTFFNEVYSGYLSLKPVEYGDIATELLGDEALMCAAFGYLDPNYAEAVASWLVQSYVIDNEGKWPSSWYAISLYRDLMGLTPQNFLLVATDPWPGSPVVSQNISQEKEIMTMTLMNSSIRYVTKYRFITMYSSTESTSSVTVVGLPSVPLLSLFPSLLKRRSRSKRV